MSSRFLREVHLHRCPVPSAWHYDEGTVWECDCGTVWEKVRTLGPPGRWKRRAKYRLPPPNPSRVTR